MILFNEVPGRACHRPKMVRGERLALALLSQEGVKFVLHLSHRDRPIVLDRNILVCEKAYREWSPSASSAAVLGDELCHRA